MRGDPSPVVIRKIQEMVAELLGDVSPKEVRQDAALFSSGLEGTELLDSLDALSLAFMVGEEFGISGAFNDDHMELASVADIACYVESQLQRRNADPPMRAAGRAADNGAIGVPRRNRRET